MCSAVAATSIATTVGRPTVLHSHRHTSSRIRCRAPMLRWPIIVALVVACAWQAAGKRPHRPGMWRTTMFRLILIASLFALVGYATPTYALSNEQESALAEIR